MAYHVKIMPRAERDLEAIFEYIHATESGAARLWYRGLTRQIRRREETPNRSPVTPEDSKLRNLLYGRKPHVYRVIYRVREKAKLVEILHIRHGARDRFDPETI